MLTSVKWDVKLENHGSLILFYTQNEAVRDWFDDNTDSQRFCGSYVVETHYAGDIIHALLAEGFNVQ